MFPLYEYKVMKGLAVGGFVLAFVVASIILFDSGVLGGGAATSDSAIASDSAAAASATAGEAGAEGAAADQAAGTATTGTRTHIVADGDSFYSIAKKYNVTISEISQLNPNVDPQNLTAGTKLVIP